MNVFSIIQKASRKLDRIDGQICRAEDRMESTDKNVRKACRKIISILNKQHSMIDRSIARLETAYESGNIPKTMKLSKALQKMI